MGQARAEPYAAVARDPCADGACGRCATTIAGEVVHACLLPAWRGGAGRPLDVRDIAELRGIAVVDGVARIGAATTHAELSRSGDVPAALASGIRVAVERDSRRIAVGGPVLRRCRWAEAALERGADPRPALELDVGGDAETVADLILPLPG